jgi:hypothetical protein
MEKELLCEVLVDDDIPFTWGVGGCSNDHD